MIRELVEARAGEDYDLYARGINPQFMRVLKTIGFDRVWARAEGQYLYDADGNRYLDMLGGFGMFNVGRNNPRIRAALVETLELDTPGSVQLGVSLVAGAACGGAAQAHARATRARVLFTSSGTEAVEAALKLGRAATRALARRLDRAVLPRAHARRALGERRSALRRALRAAPARVLAGSVRRPRRTRA